VREFPLRSNSQSVEAAVVNREFLGDRGSGNKGNAAIDRHIVQNGVPQQNATDDANRNCINEYKPRLFDSWEKYGVRVLGWSHSQSAAGPRLQHTITTANRTGVTSR